MRRIGMALAVGLVVALTGAAGFAQFSPSQAPAGSGGGQPPAEPPPSTPIPPSPGSDPNEYPGPHGTKFRFPTNLYDENADAIQQIKEARKEAARDNKRVLVMWGENRCGFCVFLNDILLNDPTISPLVKNEYVWIKVNIGKFDRNIDLAEFYDTPLMQTGFGAPALAVIDPDKDHAVAVKGGNSIVAHPMQVNRVFDEPVITEFLTKSIAPSKAARLVLNEALDRSLQSKKPVLVYFIAPQCDECAAIGAWLSRPEVAPVIARGFETVRLDTERMTGARPILNRLSEGRIIAAPQIIIVNGEGDLFEPGARFPGLPKSPDEIGRFVGVLRKAAPPPGIDEAGTVALTQSLTTPAKAQAEK